MITWNLALGRPVRRDMKQRPGNAATILDPCSSQLRVVVQPGFVDRMVPSIVGIDIAVDRLEGKYKLSPNRSAEQPSRFDDAGRSCLELGPARRGDRRRPLRHLYAVSADRRDDVW